MTELPYSLTDAVLPGDGIGKTINVPTLNIDTSWIDRSLAHGVYAGIVILPDGSEHLAAIHYGPRPALHDETVRLEAHLLDVSLQATPKEVTVMLVSFLREIHDFPNRKALAKAIEDDIAKTRAIMAKHAQKA